MTLYDTDSYLRGLDNGNRRGHIRNHSKRNMLLAFAAGVAVGITLVVEVTAYATH